MRLDRQLQLRCFCLFVFAAFAIGRAAPAQDAPDATANFTLKANVSTLSLTAGGPARLISLAATALNGFSETIEVKVGTLPAGVTASPETFSFKPGKSQTVTLAAAESAAGSATIAFLGTSGALSHTASVVLTFKIDAPTYHYNVERTGLNASETTLTHLNVNAKKFGLLRILNVDGVVDAQPLLISNLTIAGVLRDVVFVVTEHDSAYAFDANTGAQLWKRPLLPTGQTTATSGCGQISPEIGITSTPVIDRLAGPNGTIFLVGTSEDTEGNYHFRLHAVDITTGVQLRAPTEVQATYPGNGANSTGGKVIFDPNLYAERAGLLLLNGTIYMGWTSHCDGGPYTGWLMGYSESTLEQTSVLNLTPNGSEGSIWMAGSGLAADPEGYIYFLDGNGTFDTTLNAKGFPVNGDYGNGFIKVSTTGGKLAVDDYFEMFDTVSESNGDTDLGSGGAMVLPPILDEHGTTHLLSVGAGKDSNIYVVNRASMGKFNPNNDKAIYQEIDGAIGGVWSKPAYYNYKVYYGAVNDNLKAFTITNAKLATAPSFQSVNSFEYPGTTPTISADVDVNGIVWAVENSNPAVLHAYIAANLQEIYNSSQAANGRDNFGDGNKFIAPMVANGKVFVGTPSGVAVFGLLP